MRSSLVLFLFCLSVWSKLNVHIIPHTHDDVGWLKTVDQYFYGANNSIQHAGVQYIIDSVIPALEANPARKFIYVEQAFFQRWWREQDTNMQNRVKTVVANGQLEFINGGWCMHDEASTHYVAMVDQTTLGHKYIKEQFNKVPKAGWQIDPFGHSSTQASLLAAEVGFSGFFTARIDYQDKQNRQANKGLEMIWRASPSYGTTADVFFGVFDVGYGPPSGFCWDQGCSDAPIQDDPNLEDYNVPQRVDAFVNECNVVAGHIQGNDILFTMGSDFEYENANTWFKNLDKLIRYVNQDGRVSVQYSTPSIYTAAKLADPTVNLPLKTDDFFPYSDNAYSQWTGYFTSRPALKRNVRVTSNLLNLFKQIEAINNGDGSKTQTLWEADGVSQHHDGVSGTSKQHVAYDYARQLANGVTQSSTYANTVLAKWLNQTSLPITFCYQRNESVCSISQTNTGLAVILYNSIARPRQELIKIPINNPNVTLTNSKNTAATFQVYDNQVTPVVQTPNPSPYTLVFVADLPALGYTTYFIQPTNNAAEQSITLAKNIAQPGADTVIQNTLTSVTVDGTTGLLKSITDKQSGLTTTISQNFYYWISDTSSDNENPSGAYIFRPNGTTPNTIVASASKLQIVSGPVINEIRQSFSSWITQSITLINGQAQVQFHYSVGSIPIDDNIGKEVISRFSSNLASAKTSYTDSNGREFLQRIKDYRATWTYKVDQPVAGNYYPVNAATYLKDSTRQLTILNDRTQGGSSLNDGQLELMVHRRTLQDDRRGVGEPINETQSITPYPNPVRIGPGMGISGTHYVLLTAPATAAAAYRPLMDRVYADPYVAFTPVTNVASFLTTHPTQTSFVTTPLPLNVQLMTLTPWNAPGNFLVRLSHQFALNEDPNYSKTATVDLASVLKWTITNSTELSLTANQNKASMTRPKYNTQGGNSAKTDLGVRGEPTQFIPNTLGTGLQAVQVSLGPMEIKTFYVQATWN